MKYTGSLKAMLTAALLTLNAGFAASEETFNVSNSPWQITKWDDGSCTTWAILENGRKRGLVYEIIITKHDIHLLPRNKKHFKKHRNTEVQITSGSRSYILLFDKNGEWASLKDPSQYKKVIKAFTVAKIDTEFSSVVEFEIHNSGGLTRALKVMKKKCE